MRNGYLRLYYLEENRYTVAKKKKIKMWYI